MIDTQTNRYPVNKPHILLVEDDILNQEITTIYLRNNCTFDYASDGLKAIELAEKHNYTIVLMDINLGAGINGIETTKRIRRIKNYENVPFIAITAYAMNGYESKLLAEGFNYYLAKPFDKKELIDVIEEAALSKYNNVNSNVATEVCPA